jgi:hypothetical protein
MHIVCKFQHHHLIHMGKKRNIYHQVRDYIKSEEGRRFGTSTLRYAYESGLGQKAIDYANEQAKKYIKDPRFDQYREHFYQLTGQRFTDAYNATNGISRQRSGGMNRAREAGGFDNPKFRGMGQPYYNPKYSGSGPPPIGNGRPPRPVPRRPAQGPTNNRLFGNFGQAGNNQRPSRDPNLRRPPRPRPEGGGYQPWGAAAIPQRRPNRPRRLT